MEVIVESPRSSSGYGSSEEDHGCCFGLASTQPGTSGSSSSTCSTPDSLSPLSSVDLNVDLQSVFEDDDIMPDFSDLGVLPDTYGDLCDLADDWSAVSTPYAVQSPLPDYIVADVIDHVTQLATSTSGGCCGDGNILVSLLKRPKAEIDWFPVVAAAATASDDVMANCAQLESRCVDGGASSFASTATTASATTTTTTCQPEAVVAAAAAVQPTTKSPLQQLKALTQGSVVNNTELPVRPRIIINSAAAPSRPQTSTASTSVPATGAAVIRVGVVATGASQQSAGNSRVPAAVGVTSTAAASRPYITVAPTTATGLVTCSESQRQPRKHVITVSAARPSTSSSSSSSSSPPSTLSAAQPPQQQHQVRRHRSELDDHRYSSLLPVPMTSSSSSSSAAAASSRRSGAAKRNNRSLSGGVGATRTSGVSATGNRRPNGSSMLETLLLTNRTLRPNEGSEASLAACGVWTGGRRHSSESVDRASAGGPMPKRSCSDAPGSLLEHLLTGRTDDPIQLATSPRSTAMIKTEPIDEEDDDVAVCSKNIIDDERFSTDSFGLSSDKLLYDAHDLNVLSLGGLFGEDAASSWTPSCFDDQVLTAESMHQEVRQEDVWFQSYLSELL